MSAAREIATSAASKALTSAAEENTRAETANVATTYEGTAVEPETLRKVIDDSFVYLSEAQRSEVFEKLNELLLDPKVGARRAALIEFFLHKALAVRAAQMQLARLSPADQARLATQFSHEAAALPDDERQKLLTLLERGLLPVPADLNQLLLAGFQESR